MDLHIPGAPMTEDEARDLVLTFAASHCCYAKRPAREMKIINIIMSNAYHYILETYTEKRETEWCTEPFPGGEPYEIQPRSGSESAWSVLVTPIELFKDAKSKTEIPGSSYVEICIRCSGIGKVRCPSCSGTGRQNCFSCGGTGRDTNRIHGCSSCGGTGRKTCFSCCGLGTVKCSRCSGYGKVRKFMLLTVTWNNNKEDFLSVQAGLPLDKVRKCSGSQIYTDQAGKVTPIMNFPDVAVSRTSETYINKHSTAFPKQKIVQQRHQIRMIPVALAKYNWEDYNGEFVVYGIEKEVYFPNYPQTCCWGCTVL